MDAKHPSTPIAVAVASATPLPADDAQGAAPATTNTEGKISFGTSGQFRYSIFSDKVETGISMEDIKSHEKWECRLDDAAMKAAGPTGVELPRQVVTSFLSDTFEKPTDSHSITLACHSEYLQLSLSLELGAGFSPVYRLVLLPVAISSTDRLQAQVVDLQDEVVALRAEVASLRRAMKKMAQTNDDQARQLSDLSGLPSLKTLRAMVREYEARPAGGFGFGYGAPAASPFGAGDPRAAAPTSTPARGFSFGSASPF